MVTDTKINLVLNRLSKEKYDELKESHQLCSDQLYLINEQQLDGGSQTIQNVADPVNDTDAATKAYVDAHGGGSGKSKYDLIAMEKTLSSITIETVQTSAYVCNASDQAINTVQVSSDQYPLYIYLPALNSIEGARDFCVRVECLSSSVPTVAFLGSGTESCDFESEDDEWATLETGVNLFNFTETKR